MNRKCYTLWHMSSLAVASFQVEKLSDALWTELMPLLRLHYAEIAPWDDIPLSPDFARYAAIEAINALRIVTARSTEWGLIGYHCAVVMRGLHYSTITQAQQDVLWLAPAYRRSRVGSDLLTFAEEQLRAEGVTMIIQHTKVWPGFDLGPWLKRRGYEPLDMLYVKRLDVP